MDCQPFKYPDLDQQATRGLLASCCCQLIGSTPVREPSVRFGGCRPSMMASMISGAKKATRRMEFIYRGSSLVALARSRWCLHSPDLHSANPVACAANRFDERWNRLSSLIDGSPPGIINRISPRHLFSFIAMVSTIGCPSESWPRFLSWLKSRARAPSFEIEPRWTPDGS